MSIYAGMQSSVLADTNDYQFHTLTCLSNYCLSTSVLDHLKNFMLAGLHTSQHDSADAKLR